MNAAAGRMNAETIRMDAAAGMMAGQQGTKLRVGVIFGGRSPGPHDGETQHGLKLENSQEI